MDALRLLANAAAVFAAWLATLARRAVRGPRRPGWSVRTELAQTALRTTLMRSKGRDAAWLRAVQEMQPVRSAWLSRVEMRRTAVAGVPALEVTPRGGAAPARTVVYIHGGGYVIGSAAAVRDPLARIAVAAEARVLGLDYRLSPEHPFPAAQEDCLRTVRAVLAETPAARVALAGDSAGGALAVATLCALRDAGEPLPGAAVLLCPWTDPLASGGSMEANAACDFGDRELLVGWARQHLAGADAADPRVTVLRADLSGLPPLLVQVGTAEILLDQVRAFAERARAAGVDTTVEEWDEMFHDFQTLCGWLPEGARALESVARFLRERLPAEPELRPAAATRP